MTENVMKFSPEAVIKFTTGQLEDEETHQIKIHSGYELFEVLQKYYEGRYEELFGYPVFDVVLDGIVYSAKQDGIKFNLDIGTDDSAYGTLTFDNQMLLDENAKKIALIREVLDYDNEAEHSLLRQFVNGEK